MTVTEEFWENCARSERDLYFKELWSAYSLHCWVSKPKPVKLWGFLQISWSDAALQIVPVKRKICPFDSAGFFKSCKVLIFPVLPLPSKNKIHPFDLGGQFSSTLAFHWKSLIRHTILICVKLFNYRVKLNFKVRYAHSLYRLMCICVLSSVSIPPGLHWWEQGIVQNQTITVTFWYLN